MVILEHDSHHLLGNVERFRRKHRPENADHQVEALVFQLTEVGRVALLEPAVRQAMLLSALVPGFNQVAGDVDTEHVRPKFG